MNAKKAKALRRMAFAATAQGGKGREYDLAFGRPSKRRRNVFHGTTVLVGTCTRGVYQRLKRRVREHGFRQVVGSLNRAATGMIHA